MAERVGVALNFKEMADFAKIMKFISETDGMSVEEKVIKLIISGLKPEQKKNAEVIAKYIEFENMARKYKGKIYAQSRVNTNWQKNMLLDLKKSFNGKKGLKIDMLLKLMDLSEIVNKIETDF